VIYPEQLQKIVKQIFPQGYRAHIDLTSLVVDGKISEMTVFSELLAHTDHLARLTEYLMTTQPWDLCFVAFEATDIGQHIFWRYLDDKHPNHDAAAPTILKQAIAAIYQRVDEFIGRLLQAAPEDTNVIVLSDHGFCPLFGTINLNGFLVRAGYTVPMPSIRRVARWILSGLEQIQRKDRRWRPMYYSLEIDWKKTTVYAHGYMGNLFVNLRGREPKGRISPIDYEKILKAVIDDLHQWKNPVTNQPMVRAVHRSPLPIAQQYCLRGVPDLVIEWFDYRYAGIHPGSYERDFEARSPQFAYNLLRSADHNLEGMLICTGPDFEPSWSNPEAHEVSICDMPSLTMAVMELACPDHFDGTVPLGLLRSEIADKKSRTERLERQDVSSSQLDYTPNELLEIADRLKSLGYLE